MLGLGEVCSEGGSGVRGWLHREGSHDGLTMWATPRSTLRVPQGERPPSFSPDTNSPAPTVHAFLVQSG